MTEALEALEAMEAMEAVAEVVAVMAVGTNTCNNRSREIDHSAFWTSSRAPRNWCWLPSRDDCMWRMAEAKGAEALMVAEGSSTPCTLANCSDEDAHSQPEPTLRTCAEHVGLRFETCGISFAKKSARILAALMLERAQPPFRGSKQVAHIVGGLEIAHVKKQYTLWACARRPEGRAPPAHVHRAIKEGEPRYLDDGSIRVADPLKGVRKGDLGMTD